MGRRMAPGSRRSRIGTLGGVIGGLLSGRLRAFEIAEDSMRPTLADGDWVISLHRPRSLRPGDVVVLEHPERPGFDLVKRIASVEHGTIVVRGDNPSAGSVDSSTFGAVERDAVSARVVLRYRPLPPRLVR